MDVPQAKTRPAPLSNMRTARASHQTRLGPFKYDRRAVAQWALEVVSEVVVMQSTGMYWKNPFAALRVVGVIAWEITAPHVKAVPGRKPDMADA